MAGASLAGSASEKSPCPEQRPIVDPVMASNQTDIPNAHNVPDESISPKQLYVSPEQVNAPVQLAAPEQVIAPPEMEIIPAQVNASPAAGTCSTANANPEVLVSKTDDQSIPNQVQNGSPSRPSDQAEQSWTFVSKAKGSPARTIMTRGKCVAIGEQSPSRYQILEKEPPNLDDIEDGEIQGIHNKDSSSDEADSEALAPIGSSQGEGNRIHQAIKTHATRQKDKNKASRQNYKSKKPSSRKA